MNSLPKNIIRDIYEEHQNSINIRKEQGWNNRFTNYKIPNYDSFKDKNVKLYTKILYNPNSNINKKFHIVQNYSSQNIANFPIKNSPNDLHRSKSIDSFTYLINSDANKTRKIKIKNLSARNGNFTHLQIINNPSLTISNKTNLNSPKYNFQIDYSRIDDNFKQLFQKWDELYVPSKYRKSFYFLYKETDNKENFFLEEYEELSKMISLINSLKNNINLRINILSELFYLNQCLNKILINNNKTEKEKVLMMISKKIQKMREYTINICINMKKIKKIVFKVDMLKKYDLDLLAEKYGFDKNYLLKMKQELNFLKDGYMKYFFNIAEDQTPFLLKCSETNKNKKDSMIRIVPLNNEQQKIIMKCLFYIYQELIAYQNTKKTKYHSRSISPLKQNIYINKSDNQKKNVKEDEKIKINKNKNAYHKILEENNDVNIIKNKNNFDVKNINRRKSNNFKKNKLISFSVDAKYSTDVFSFSQK